MSRAQLALRVPDLEQSVAFYSKLFGAEPAKRREGYANFALTEPPLKLVLIEGDADTETRLDHLGVEVESTEAVDAATQRLKDAGLVTFEEADTTCCYALQDKVWVTAPGAEPWEVYVVKADADAFGTSADTAPTGAAPAAPASADTAPTGAAPAAPANAAPASAGAAPDACCAPGTR
ncbi:VOC family protein [Streptomyces sp. JJ66]|uniref:ArsI/CadI family heavy metal resistance metalloenzyme n=1 Tax=Streptomyces sp. JJ66 TaxID=2803843 RepID=UPI001C574AD1|nr:ArsI/CadI family heavy metal resistance metalloenzyme [Streptomyces sp. JJ66]MBW1602712.1 VOC family protein [Streptomyces sp. JJ66]